MLHYKQSNSEGADKKRARYHSSILDAHLLRPKEDFSKLPETFVIFITENDVLGENEPIYIIDRQITNVGKPFDHVTCLDLISYTIDKFIDVDKKQGFRFLETLANLKSGRRDSNTRPPRPEYHFLSLFRYRFVLFPHI